ncbi:Sigma-54-dependent Fis family transcriptional regulator [Sulfidibacter corallicola]|uniref:Sigma-54-dependent Fis family transcriptional regulator n=1 Tax=Sulfidibacter corallicola TaxID=2818388 RepID=A0A8A4U3W0_SULCO|nr:sigma-54 dependent transcriptional regulator [Sulfidibacter corallicola]QTD53435.1 sigma-54-dependent Fis family transcriptional regulator [Sulfidibacter corallicola]
MSSGHPRILIADDKEEVLRALRLLLKSEGYRTELAGSPGEVCAKLERSRFDLALIDMNYTRDTTSGEEGLDLLAVLRMADADLPIVVMTAYATVNLAVSALQRGARDFVEKPWDNQRLLSIVKNQLALGRVNRRNRHLQQENRLLVRDREDGMIARSPAMNRVLDLIERVAPTDANILITGEHGTGKGLTARALHAGSDRAGEMMITVNTGALSDSLFESELFGHTKGAFTDARTAREGRFKRADGGTLFLDEIGNISLPLQAKLLRVIETGEFEPLGSSRTEAVDVRLLSATNADLGAMAREGSYREDLLFRLNTIEIRLPPLRARHDDIIPLAESFLERHAAKYQKAGIELSPEARSELLAHSWPGNVRELDHAIQRGVLLARGFSITAADLGLVAPATKSAATATRPNLEHMTLDQAERHLIERALFRTDGNIKAAARELGLGRSSLYRRMEKYKLDPHAG